MHDYPRFFAFAARVESLARDAGLSPSRARVVSLKVATGLPRAQQMRLCALRALTANNTTTEGDSHV